MRIRLRHSLTTFLIVATMILQVASKSSISSSVRRINIAAPSLEANFTEVPHESSVRIFPHPGYKNILLDEIFDASSFDNSYQFLYVARHSETDMNNEGKMQGRGFNSKLNEKGIEQAKDLGKFLSHVPLFIASSSLMRASETANLVSSMNVNPKSPFREMTSIVIQLSGLDEISWGWLEGKDKYSDPVKSTLNNLVDSWSNGHINEASEGGESPAEVLVRSYDSVKNILNFGHRHNLVVTHGRTMRILLTHLAGFGLQDMNRFGSVPNTGMYIFAHKDGKFILLQPRSDLVELYSSESNNCRW